MRLHLWLRVVPFALGALAHAQPATDVTAAPAPLAACLADADCGAGATCLNKVCAPNTAAPPSLLSRFTLGIGLGTFGEAFPSSTVKVPGTSRGQLSMLVGIRFSIGVQLPDSFRVMVVIQSGYGFSGYFPGRAADGIMEGAGLEVTLEYFKRLKPFVRFMYNAQVVPIRTSTEGELAQNAYFASAGVRFFIFELYASLGKDLAGGVSPGAGFGLGWVY